MWPVLAKQGPSFKADVSGFNLWPTLALPYISTAAQWTWFSAIHVYKIIHCYLSLVVVHTLSTSLLHLNTPLPQCNITNMLYVDTWVNSCMLSFCCFLKFASVNIFASVTWGFFYPLNSLNRVRICASTAHSAPRNLQTQDCVMCVIARFPCYYTKKKNLGQCTKFCKIV